MMKDISLRFKIATKTGTPRRRRRKDGGIFTSYSQHFRVRATHTEIQGQRKRQCTVYRDIEIKGKRQRGKRETADIETDVQRQRGEIDSRYRDREKETERKRQRERDRDKEERDSGYRDQGKETERRVS